MFKNGESHRHREKKTYYSNKNIKYDMSCNYPIHIQKNCTSYHILSIQCFNNVDIHVIKSLWFRNSYIITMKLSEQFWSYIAGNSWYYNLVGSGNAWVQEWPSYIKGAGGHIYDLPCFSFLKSLWFTLLSAEIPGISLRRNIINS